MKPRLFPEHFNLVLEEAERSALQTLYDLDPHLMDEAELVHRAVREGIKVLNKSAEEARRNPDRGPTRRELAAQRRSGKRASLHPEHRQVENYIAMPLDEHLRRRLEKFLRRMPKAVSEEEVFAMLLEKALDVEEQDSAKGASSRRERFLVRRARLRALLDFDPNRRP